MELEQPSRDSGDMNPENIDQWFSVERQRDYISKLTKRMRVGLTRCRAEYFVRLWAYLLLKQQQELGQQLKPPLTHLYPPQGFVPCTLREADAVFYSHKDRGRGSERAAGMMLDKLVALGLIKKRFDGNTICIQIQSLPELASPPAVSVQLKVDAFDPETDAIPVANFLVSKYKWMNRNTAAPHRIARLLRDWFQQYSTGMRVLRRCDNFHPVGFYVLYPMARASEKYFSLPPSKSLHLSSAEEIDPIIMASLGDPDCNSVFVRSWMIDAPYDQQSHVCHFLEDVQRTLVRMQADFPNIHDLYGLIIHPSYEELTLALEFQKIGQDRQFSVYWMYTAIRQFLTLDIEQAVSRLEFAPPPEA